MEGRTALGLGVALLVLTKVKQLKSLCRML
jgi:hypothetical protein